MRIHPLLLISKLYSVSSSYLIAIPPGPAVGLCIENGGWGVPDIKHVVWPAYFCLEKLPIAFARIKLALSHLAMSHVLQESNHQDLAHSASLRFGPAPVSVCAFKRMATAAANEQKVFVLHDDGENSTAARLRTGELAHPTETHLTDDPRLAVALARLFDSSEIVTYYRNAMHKVPSFPGDNNESLRVSWSGKDQNDLVV
jgi:hypothetical protein